MSRIFPLVLLTLALTPPMAARDKDIDIRRVFGPEIPGKYKHPASFTELRNGDLFLVYHGGEGEYAKDTAVMGSRLKAGQASWSRPRPVADTPFRGEGNAVAWQAPDGLVWLFYVTRYGPTWSTSRVKVKISRDGARTWSDPFLLSLEQGLMVRNQPIVLSGGDYLLPLYHETGSDTERVPADSTSLFMRYDVKKQRWSQTPRIRSRRGNIQPAVVELTAEHLVCYCRRGGGYGLSQDGYLVRSESRDGGRTWAPGRDSKFPNPNAAVEFIKLRNGHLLLIFNDSMSDRTPLTAAISVDGDRTYPYRRNIIAGPGPYAYPYAFQARDGKIHLIFTSDDRTVVRHAVFEESAIREPN